MRKYIVGRPQKHLVVTPKAHALVKLYAEDHQITIVEATYELLREAFAKKEGLKLDQEMN